MQIKSSPYLQEKLPNLKLHTIHAQVDVKMSIDDFWESAIELIETKARLSLNEIKEIETIRHSRDAYKILGKEPSRYRLSAEALHRRVIRGLGLYRINNVVDIVNYISLKSGISIGGYDADKIDHEILADVGNASDIYHSIGRGVLNIENMPVLRDNNGPFGTPTSDSDRSKISEETKNILLVFWLFKPNENIEDVFKESIFLLRKYANSESISSCLYC
jgi:DNA/RNA-binding domain of Phe-tRNA-synthetase-like protein